MQYNEHEVKAFLNILTYAKMGIEYLKADLIAGDARADEYDKNPEGQYYKKAQKKLAENLKHLDRELAGIDELLKNFNKKLNNHNSTDSSH